MDGAFGLVNVSGQSATQPANSPACFQILDKERQLAKRRHKSATVPLDVHPTGERVRRRRPVFYRWLFTRRVTRKRWLKWVHLLLFRRFGPNMQSPTAGFRFIGWARSVRDRKIVIHRLTLRFC